MLRTERAATPPSSPRRSSRGRPHLRLLRRRRLQRGAERRAPGGAARLRAGRRHERAAAGARAAARSGAGGARLAAGGRGGSRSDARTAAASASARARPRRRAHPPHGRARPGRDGKRPGDLAFVWTLCADARSAPRALRAGAGDRGHGTGGLRARRELRPVHLRRPPAAAADRAARASRAGSTLVAPRAFRAAHLPGARRYLADRPRPDALATSSTPRPGPDRVRAFEPMPLQVDGEDLGDVTEVVFEAERDAVDVVL